MRAPTQSCGSCAAFVPRFRPKDEEARAELERIGNDLRAGACHLNPQAVAKLSDDFCLQHRRKA